MCKCRQSIAKDIKVKVKLALCLTKYYTMKTYWGVEVQPHAFLTPSQGYVNLKDSEEELNVHKYAEAH
jgi:hypothetical protein